MLTRRMLASRMLAGLLGTQLFVRSASAQEAAFGQAVSFIRDAGNRLAAVSQQGGSDAERLSRLEAFLSDVVDIDAIGKFCLGRYARTATPAQLSDYLAAFHRVLVNNVSSRVGGYTKDIAKITVDTPSRVGTDIQVPMRVDRPGQPTLKVAWVVEDDAGKPRIVDLIAEGISLRVTQRSDYVTFIDRNGGDITVLIRRLQELASATKPA